MKAILFNVKRFINHKETVTPSVEVICNYCKNILVTAKMEKEVAIICLVYIERVLILSGFHLSPLNWRKITFTSLVKLLFDCYRYWGQRYGMMNHSRTIISQKHSHSSQPIKSMNWREYFYN